MKEILSYWASDKDCPYTEVKRFDWFRGYHVGGRSLMWGRQSYRWSDFDFEANAKDGIAVDWPIRYKDIAPWYDYVEKFAGISGSIEGLPQLPDGKFLPPMDLNCVEKDVAARIKENYEAPENDHRPCQQILQSAKPEENRQCQFQKYVCQWLSVWWLFQHTIIYTTCCNENRKSYAAPFLHRYKNYL